MVVLPQARLLGSTQHPMAPQARLRIPNSVALPHYHTSLCPQLSILALHDQLPGFDKYRLGL